jgi:hypothetical protein
VTLVHGDHNHPVGTLSDPAGVVSSLSGPTTTPTRCTA